MRRVAWVLVYLAVSAVALSILDRALGVEIHGSVAKLVHNMALMLNGATLVALSKGWRP